MFEPLVPVLVFLITAGVKNFFDRVLGKPLGSAESAIIAAFVAALIVFGNAVVVLLPPAALPALTVAIQLLVLIASAFGVHATAKLFAHG